MFTIFVLYTRLFLVNDFEQYYHWGDELYCASNFLALGKSAFQIKKIVKTNSALYRILTFMQWSPLSRTLVNSYLRPRPVDLRQCITVTILPQISRTPDISKNPITRTKFVSPWDSFITVNPRYLEHQREENIWPRLFKRWVALSADKSLYSINTIICVYPLHSDLSAV